MFDTRMEIRATGEKKSIVGLAAVFNKWSVNLGGFREMILPGAFDGCDMSDVQCLFNHRGDNILARQYNGEGTLQLRVVEDGLEYEFDVPDHQLGAMVRTAIERKDIRHSSFAFDVDPNGDEWELDKVNGYYLRKIKKFIRLYDVSPVNNPAYPDTEVTARSQDAMKKLKELQEADERKQKGPGELYYSKLRLENHSRRL